MERAEYIKRMKLVYQNATRELGEDLMGGSILDLMADNFPHLSLATIKELLAEAGIA